jgi:DNA-binding response OmpR family regulator
MLASQYMWRILLLSDHEPTRLQLRFQLASEFEVIEAGTLERAADDLKSRRAECLLVAWRAPGGQSASLIGEVRRSSGAPVLYLTAQAEVDACVAALDAGADDFIALPCGAQELRARIRSALRRCRQLEKKSVLRLGALSLDFDGRTVSRAQRHLRLTALECRLLEALAEAVPGMAVSAQQLLRGAWGLRDWQGDTRRLRTCIKKLRGKLEPDPARPRYLVCVPGLGYRLQRDSRAEG